MKLPFLSQTWTSMLLPFFRWIMSPETSRGTSSTPSSASVSRGAVLDIGGLPRVRIFRLLAAAHSHGGLTNTGRGEEAEDESRDRGAEVSRKSGAHRARRPPLTPSSRGGEESEG